MSKENFTKKALDELNGKGFNINIVENLFLYTHGNGYQIVMDLDKMSVTRKVDNDSGKQFISITQGAEQIILNPSPDHMDSMFEFLFQAKLNFFKTQKRLSLFGHKSRRKLRHF